MKTKQPVAFQLVSLIIHILWFKLRSDCKHKILNYLFCQHFTIKNLVALEFLKHENMFRSIKWHSHLYVSLQVLEKRKMERGPLRQSILLPTKKCCGNVGTNHWFVYMRNWGEYWLLLKAHAKQTETLLSQKKKSPNPELFWIVSLF